MWCVPFLAWIICVLDVLLPWHSCTLWSSRVIVQCSVAVWDDQTIVLCKLCLLSMCLILRCVRHSFCYVAVLLTSCCFVAMAVAFDRLICPPWHCHVTVPFWNFTGPAVGPEGLRVTLCLDPLGVPLGFIFQALMCLIKNVHVFLIWFMWNQRSWLFCQCFRSRTVACPVVGFLLDPFIVHCEAPSGSWTWMCLCC